MSSISYVLAFINAVISFEINYAAAASSHDASKTAHRTDCKRWHSTHTTRQQNLLQGWRVKANGRSTPCGHALVSARRLWAQM